MSLNNRIIMYIIDLSALWCKIMEHETCTRTLTYIIKTGMKMPQKNTYEKYTYVAHYDKLDSER